MGFHTKRNNQKGLMELHTFRIQGLYLADFNPVVKVCNKMTTNLNTNFTHETMFNLQPSNIFCGCHADTAAYLSKIYLQELMKAFSYAVIM
jgi:hypothetical protein